MRKSSHRCGAGIFFFFSQGEKLLKVSLEKKCSKEGRNPWFSFIVNLIITNGSVREGGLKEVVCQ